MGKVCPSTVKNETRAVEKGGLLAKTATAHGFEIILMEGGLLFVTVIACDNWWLIVNENGPLHGDDGGMA